MSTTVTTQAELDAAIAAGAEDIVINSPAGVWLTLFALDHAENLQAYRHSVVIGLSLGLLRLGSVLSLSLVVTAAATVVGLVPGLMIQGLRHK